MLNKKGRAEGRALGSNDIIQAKPALMALARAFALFAGAFALSGCPNPNTYGTARTTPPGKLSFTVAPEAWGFRTQIETTDAAGNRTTEKFSGAFPVPPTFQLRLGVADQVDLGFRVNNLTSLGFDTKVNLLKDTIDLALDPGIQWYRLSIESGTGPDQVDESFNVFYLHGPLLIDFNLNETVTVVLAPGVVYGLVTSDVEVSGDDADVTSATTSEGFFGRLGLGFDFRVNRGFAIHPEVTAMRSFSDDPDLIYMFGLGFNFGKLPSFDDMASQEP